ncbi:phosphoheptose isomerase [bacterium]|nr:phosphoheptose isomerase [bacterium]
MELEHIELQGKKLSPVLGKGKKNLMIDIDGTICEDIPNEEPERMLTALEFAGARETINAWFDAGHIITFFTSRESLKHREITEQWLAKHGFKYHNLLMDKPRGGNYHWIDNHIVKGIKYSGDWHMVKNDTEA